VLNFSLECLRKRSDFLRVSKTGEKWITPAFVLQVYARDSEGSSRYGITASKKIGGAVERNRAKRRLRALIRAIPLSLVSPGMDYVFIARQEILKRDFVLMGNELSYALRKLAQKVVKT